MCLQVVQDRGREAQWPLGQCTRLQSEQSGPCPGLGHCVVFLGKTLNCHGALSPPTCINGYQRIYHWGLTLQWTSISFRGEQKHSLSLYATETGISSGWMGHLAHMQTHPLPKLEKTNCKKWSLKSLFSVLQVLCPQMMSC